MNTIAGTLQKVSQLDGAVVDQGYAQGVISILEHIKANDPNANIDAAQRLSRSLQDGLKDIHSWVYRYVLPEDYTYFLEYWGGLHIKTNKFYLEIMGIGIMVDSWYSYLMGDEGFFDPSDDGVILLGSLGSQQPIHGAYFRVYFILDVAGIFQAEQSIGVGTLTTGNSIVRHIVKTPATYVADWKILANSFSQWLELVATSAGSCGYTFSINESRV